MTEQKQYKVGDRAYFQTVPVILQGTQLISLVKDVEYDWENINAITLVSKLIDAGILIKSVAVILRREGITLKAKDIKEEAEYLEENMTIEQGVEVVTDFFTLNDISKKLSKAIESGKIANFMQRIQIMFSGANQENSG